MAHSKRYGKFSWSRKNRKKQKAQWNDQVNINKNQWQEYFVNLYGSESTSLGETGRTLQVTWRWRENNYLQR